MALHNVLSGLQVPPEIRVRDFRGKQAQQAKDFQAGIDKGARVVTTGGIHGKIIKVDDNSVMLEIDNNVKIRIEKSGISMEMSQTAYGADTEKKSDTPAAK